jgi:hypothetical protein
MEVLNFLFLDRVMGAMTDEVLMRLKANESMGTIAAQIGDRFDLLRGYTKSADVLRIIDHWPEAQLDMIRDTVIRGLEQRQKGVAMRFHFRGDDEYPETLTRIEVRENDITIEFLHPPVVTPPDRESPEVLRLQAERLSSTGA